MQPCRGSRLGGGVRRGAGWCERLQRARLQQGWGRARLGLRAVRGPLVAALPVGKLRSPTRWHSLACLPAARTRALFTSEAWT